jgi:aspartyl/asparaginyl beta-hydroxylase (cupin superfamily)
MIAICSIVIIVIAIWVWYHPEWLFTPINLLLQMDSSPRTNFYNDEERNIIFPVGMELESIWEIIRSEGYNLYDLLPDKNINYLDSYNIDLGSETKRNWTTIPLRLFGYNYMQYMSQCPQLSLILRLHPEIKSCIFSIMEAGKIIQPHVGPYDGLLRYQLALDIPIISNEEECYLYVGEEQYYWKEGEGVLFDEANLHGAVNTTKHKRMVLLIDIERPYNFLPYRLINRLVITCMGLLPTAI